MSNLPHIVRQRLGASSGADHPDADLLTAFAERQLTARERERVLAHLGTCAICREIFALAAPETIATQPVLTPARTGSWWSIRSYQYGALAAALAIAAFGLALLRPDRAQQFQKVAQVAAAPQPKPSTERSDAAADSAEKMQREPATSSAHAEERTRVAATSDSALAKKSVTIATPSAAPPKELDQLADNSYAFQTSRTDAKRDREVRYSNTMNDSGPTVADAAKPASVATEARANRETASVNAADLPAAAAAKTAPVQQPSPPSASSAVAHGAPLSGNPPARVVTSTKDAYAPKSTEVSAANGAVTTESATSANALASQDSGAPVGHLATLQRAPMTARAGALAKTEEEKQKALARDPNYSKRAAIWRINNGRLQKLDPTRSAFDDVAISGTSRLSVVGSLGSEVWVGGTGGALYYSNDQGAHWITVSTGGWSKDATFTGITPTALRSVEVHLSNGQRWRSADAGASWSRYE